MASFITTVLTVLSALAARTFADDEMKVWASVVYARGGDRVPQTGSMYSGELTANGAQQMEDLGKFLRGWYLSDTGIPNMSRYFVSPGQLYALASDSEQSTTASAQALMQGLYPPTKGDTGGEIDPLGTYSIGTLEAPLGNYQYPLIHTAGRTDEESIYVNGAENCPLFNDYFTAYQQEAATSDISTSTRDLYSQVGNKLEDANYPSEAYSYWNAAQTFEYIDYLNTHNASALNKLNTGKLFKMDAYNRTRYLADHYNWNLYGNLKDGNNPIMSIAGQTLASRVIELLRINVGSTGAEYKLSVLVGDHTPLISFFGLANIQVDGPGGFNENITGTPAYGSAAMFELVAPSDAKLYKNSLGDEYPSPADLSVRFAFRNGTSEGAQLIDYPLFGTGSFYMPWEKFSSSMDSIGFSGPGDWCGACDAWGTSSFCMFYNTTAYNAAFGLAAATSLFSGFGSHLSPVVAGVIGAFVTIALFLLVLVPLILFGGLRFRMEKKMLKDGNGGFKGSQKMASDADLTIVKNDVGVNVEDHGTKERIGSWELKNQAAADRALNLGETLQPPQNSSSGPNKAESFVSSVRPSFDAHDPVSNPFQDPVKPREHV